MKLAMCMGLGATGLATLGLVVGMGIQGCSSSDSGTTGGTGGGSQTGTVPPARPTSGTATTEEHNFALYTVALGDGTPDWKSYGYNIDGLITDASYQNVCNPVAGTSKSKLVDGPGGIDNSFGENIIPLIGTLVTGLSGTVTSSLQKGSFTIMLDTVGLDSTSTQNATGLTGKIFGGEHFDQGPNAAGSLPKWDGTDVWPVSKSFLTDPTNATSAKIVLSNAYVANGKFVNGDPTSVQLQLSISGHAIQVPVSHAIITFDHAGSAANNGIIGGVINAAQLIANLKPVAGSISASLCTGSAFDQIAASINAAADIMSDGTAGAGQTCDAISIGIGFTGKEIKAPSVVGDPTAATDPCATDAGTGDTDAGQ